MKVNFNTFNTNVNFKGYKPAKSEFGDKEFEFNYVYDDSKYDCYLELFSLAQDENGNYYTTDILKDTDYEYDEDAPPIEHGIKLESGKSTRIDLAGRYGIAEDEPFAYHYKLYPKGKKESPIYCFDTGNTLNQGNEIYNIVTGNAPTLTKGGSMKLVIPDCHNVIWKYDNKNNVVMKTPEEIVKLMNSSKNIVNKIGGSLAGIEKSLDNGDFDNFTRIITTPLFTDDSLSGHAYWNKNCFQMANSLGNINNYANIQRKLFAKGINLVSDGAYVNEGLEGIHFKNILKWGQNSPYINWFKVTGLGSSPLSLGVFGKDLTHVTHRLVNSPYRYIQNDDGTISVLSNRKNYNPKKPTYIQIYDDRLTNAGVYSNQELIKAYEKLENNINVNNHNDTVIPYSFKINPDTYKENAIRLGKYNKTLGKSEPHIKLESGIGTRTVCKFETFSLDGKHESGFNTWDANPDIAKLNFAPSHDDTEDLKNIVSLRERQKIIDNIKRGNIEVQDYAITSGKYWTKKTNQILNLNVAQNLKNINGLNAKEIFAKIKNLSDGKIFPKNLDVTEDMVRNVLNKNYELYGDSSVESFLDYTLEGLMDVPLDSIEVGDDIAGVLASPYITKRAIKEDQIGLSRFEMLMNGNEHILPEYKDTYELTTNMYAKEMLNLAREVIISIKTKLPEQNEFFDQYGNATPYGKYVIPHLTAEIARFAVIKGLFPNIEFSYDKQTGDVAYDYNKLKDTSLLQIGIVADSPESEAISVIKKIKKGIRNISKSDKEKFASAMLKKVKGTDLTSFRLAEMIVDRSQAGLDWRIDATKDIADVESLRAKFTDFEYTWDKIIDFWKKFNDGVKEYHPDAYIAAEVTNPDAVYNDGDGWHSGSRYSNHNEAVRKLINEAGFTTLANYSYYSSDLTQIFGKLFDYDGKSSPDKGLNHGTTLLDKMVGRDNFFFSEPLESLLYSYTFPGNHDKCRALEGYAVDMSLVYEDLTDAKNFELRERAYKILHGMGYGDKPSSEQVNSYDYSRVSNFAVAKSESIASGMGKAKESIGLSEKRKLYVYEKMLAALKNLSNGKHKGKTFEADGFGTRDFNIALDIVLDEMDYLEKTNSKKLTKDERKKLKDKTFENIIDPAMSKLLGQTKFLVALNGNPTLYAGDELGSTGYETTTKNIYLQNRNVIHEEWADPKSENYKEFVKRHKDNLLYQYGLRMRKELQPLNDGTPFALKPQTAYYNGGATNVSALLRQSPNGAMTVSVFNTTNLNHQYDSYYDPAEITLDKIDLNEDWNGKVGLRGGLKKGMKFKNADSNDNTTYYVNANNEITGPDGSSIKFKDSTLILYHEPSFTGRRRTLYNPQFNIVSNPYANVNKAQHNVGEKLALVK